jgi:hypothetical protein
MKHYLHTIRTAISRRLAQRRSASETDQLAVVTDDQQRLLKLRWWRWRHCFLEMKRLQIESRTDR